MVGLPACLRRTGLYPLTTAAADCPMKWTLQVQA
uniref:Uncharacterized protein n=1 Tax=Setaria italica TaxID=4555 RepID=K3ZPT0_SETIT